MAAPTRPFRFPVRILRHRSMPHKPPFRRQRMVHLLTKPPPLPGARRAARSRAHTHAHIAKTRLPHMPPVTPPTSWRPHIRHLWPQPDKPARHRQRMVILRRMPRGSGQRRFPPHLRQLRQRPRPSAIRATIHAQIIRLPPVPILTFPPRFLLHTARQRPQPAIAIARRQCVIFIRPPPPPPHRARRAAAQPVVRDLPFMVADQAQPAGWRLRIQRQRP